MLSNTSSHFNQTKWIQFFLLVISWNAFQYCSALSTDQNGEGRVNRIYGGTEAEPHQYPWMVLLKSYKDDPSFSYICGGSVISDRCILTASYCVKDFSYTKILLGVHNKSDDNEVGRQEYISRQFYVHDETMPLSTRAPALLILPVKITYNDYIQPIRIPKTFKDSNGTLSSSEPDHVGDPVVLAGWGTTYDNPAGSSPVLQKVDTTVISNSDCRKDFSFEVNDFVICTSGERQIGPCLGDGGVPVMFHDETDGYWTQIGVQMSTSTRGCDLNLPALNFRLQSPHVLDWIDSFCGEGHSPPFVCQPDCIGAYPDPENCTRYYTCFDEVATLQQCPDGFAFNSETLKCEDFENVPNCQPPLQH